MARREKLKVLHVLNDLRGGATMSALALMRAGKGLNSTIQHYVIYPGPFGRRHPSLDGVAEDYSAAPITTWQQQKRRTTRGWMRWIKGELGSGFGFRSRRTLSKLIGDWGIDVVHTNTAIIADGARVAMKLGLPHVWHIRERVGINGFMQFRLSDQALARLIADHSTAIPVISRYVQEFFEIHGQADKTELVHDGTDLLTTGDPQVNQRGIELRRRWGIPEGAVVVGMVGGLKTRVKRHDLFVESASDVARIHPETFFLIVGSFPVASERRKGTWASRMLDLAARSGLNERLVFTGHQDDMPAVWSAIDIYVHLCAVEGFSRAILEAMATGKSVVAVDGGGNPEAISNEDTGLLIPTEEEPQACISALSRLISSPELRRRLGTRAVDEAENKYSVETHYRVMEKIFVEAARETVQLESSDHAANTA